MKRGMSISLAAVAMVLTIGGCSGKEQAVVKMESLQDKVSYGIGLRIGRDFKAQQVELSTDLLMKGIEDGLAGTEPLLTDDEIRETMVAFQKEMVAKEKTRLEEATVKNAEEGKKYLEDNAKKEGVQTLPSGLQYKVITEGTGKQPAAEDMVKVHYRGTLVDGTEFDSSYARKEPAELRVGGVIPGWTEALQLMKEGSKWQLVLPPELAYGERGAGPRIGPNATLVFEVELLEVKPQEK
ncbi:peptidylprolyl cis-trans isomerase, FKBP-type [Syntrophotalea carbinolica DSM 2380]|uniref:Peptidyl-prolyl cis-trans isomerase n=1 Tax=Syntrophotalea carbinolica (strain DSM 2380 / NBRC 103641 / GraBd1) TaxID=338963 RepID=Q3A6H4_SYNC1|nr:FKBP-type peptidyl-prolyl cis-trans isomerase [Syntrophotalea carbinolica]ABA88033.1 peptidylprolyl cis-trans isomerase, FKBP-type [Syntrophotalea carbinolica DSM 2380]